jgi:hypothetical protein
MQLSVMVFSTGDQGHQVPAQSSLCNLLVWQSLFPIDFGAWVVLS